MDKATDRALKGLIARGLIKQVVSDEDDPSRDVFVMTDKGKRLAPHYDALESEHRLRAGAPALEGGGGELDHRLSRFCQRGRTSGEVLPPDIDSN